MKSWSQLRLDSQAEKCPPKRGNSTLTDTAMIWTRHDYQTHHRDVERVEEAQHHFIQTLGHFGNSRYLRNKEGFDAAVERLEKAVRELRAVLEEEKDLCEREHMELDDEY